MQVSTNKCFRMVDYVERGRGRPAATNTKFFSGVINSMNLNNIQIPTSGKSLLPDMIAVGRRLYNKNLIAATDGNLSARLGTDRYIVTRSGICKGEMTEDDLLTCDQDGRPVNCSNVSSEIHLHLAIYRLRADVSAVIHAHPPMVVACSLAGIDLSEPILPEAVMTLGPVPTTRFAAPTSPDGARVIADLIKEHDAVILDRHGSITVGKTIWDAYYKLERLEFSARVIYLASLTGKIKKLTSSEIDKINKAADDYRTNLTEG